MNAHVFAPQAVAAETTTHHRALFSALLLWAALLWSGIGAWAAVTTSVVTSAPANPITGYYQSTDAQGWQWKWTTDSGRRDVGQTFTAPQDFTLDKCAIRINNPASGTTLSGAPFVYKLYTFPNASSTSPGTLVTSTTGTLPTYTGTSPYSPDKWLLFDVPDSVLSQGQVYGVVFSFNSALANQAITFNLGTTNLYSGGTGLFSTDGANWSRQASFNFGIYGATPIALDLQTLITDAIRDNPTAPTVTLPRGIYKVTSNNTIIENATNFTLDGSGSTLIFPPSSSWALATLGCSGVTYKNFKVDYDPLPFTQATITAISADKKQINFTTHAGYPDLNTFGAIKQAYAFDGATRTWRLDVADLYPSSTAVISATQGQFTFNSVPPGADKLQVGDLVAMTNRAGDALKFTRGTKNIALSDVTVFTAPGCAVICSYLSGTNTFTRLKIQRGPLPTGATQPRLMSTGADGLHYATSRSGPIVTNCDFGWMGDDSINIYGALLPVLRVDSPTVFWTVRPFTQDYLQSMPQANDTIRVLGANNFAPKATPTLQLFQPGTYTPALTAAQLGQLWPALKPTTTTYYKVTVNSTANMQAGDWIDIPALNSPNFSIQNSTFHDHRARGFRIQASHGLINNNQLQRIKANAMTFGGMYSYWREAGWVEDVTVSNNTILDVAAAPEISGSQSSNPGAISVLALRDESGYFVPTANSHLSFTGNTISGSTVAGIHINAASGVSISGNTISRCNTVNNAATGSAYGLSSGYAICVNNSVGVTIGTNTFGTPGAYQIGNVQPY